MVNLATQRINHGMGQQAKDLRLKIHLKLPHAGSRHHGTHHTKPHIVGMFEVQALLCAKAIALCFLGSALFVGPALLICNAPYGR